MRMEKRAHMEKQRALNARLAPLRDCFFNPSLFFTSVEEDAALQFV
jgi:hypothetical protein